jgi:phage-related protein
MYRIWYTPLVGKSPKSLTGVRTQPEALERQGKHVPAIFFRTEAGGEPVRDWLKGLPSSEDRKRIGQDIKTVEFGWPIGMPVCRPLGDGIYEVRTSLAQNRIARVLFYIDKKGRMVLLHGFIKKTQKTPGEDLELARNIKKKHQRGLP